MSRYEKAMQILIDNKELQDDGIKGIEFLRKCVNWCNHRGEDRNEGKTPQQLLNEFALSIINDPETVVNY